MLLAEADAALHHLLCDFLPIVVDFGIVAHTLRVRNFLAHFVHFLLFLFPSASCMLLLLDDLLDLLISFLRHHLFDGLGSLNRFFVFDFHREFFVFAMHFSEVCATLGGLIQPTFFLRYLHCSLSF